MLVDAVRANGGFVGLIYVALSSPTIAQERVAARVKRGGHGIPEDKIELRWKRSLEHLAWFVQHATAFWVVDNSNSDPSLAPALIASGKNGNLEFLIDEAFAELKAAIAAFI